MMIELNVENIKCGGCANTITTKLKALEGVKEVAVDIECGMVQIDGDEAQRADYAQALVKMGYPEVGSVDGLASTGAKVKSFVSCAIGRVNEN